MIGLSPDLPISLDLDIALMILCNAKEREDLEKNKTEIGQKKTGSKIIPLSQIFSTMLNKDQKIKGK